MIPRKIQKVLCAQVFKDVEIHSSDSPAVIRGKTASISKVGKDLVIYSDAKEILRANPKMLDLYFHQGWGGIDIIDRSSEIRTTYTLHHVVNVVYPKMR